MQMERGTITLAVLWILRDRSEITGEGGDHYFCRESYKFFKQNFGGSLFFLT